MSLGLAEVLGSEEPKTLGQTLEAIKPMLAQQHYDRIKESFKGKILVSATKADIDHINAQYWEWFKPRQEAIAPYSAMVLMNELRIWLSTFNIHDDGTLFDHPSLNAVVELVESFASEQGDYDVENLPEIQAGLDENKGVQI